MARLTLTHFKDRLERLCAEHRREAKMAANRIRDDAMRVNAYGGSRMDVTIYAEIERQFKALALALLGELQASKARLNGAKAEKLTLELLRQSAADFGEMATYEAPGPWPSRRNVMADRTPAFVAAAETFWQDYRTGVLFASPSASLPWFQRPAGLFAIGLLIAIVGGMIVALLV